MQGWLAPPMLVLQASNPILNSPIPHFEHVNIYLKRNWVTLCSQTHVLVNSIGVWSLILCITLVSKEILSKIDRVPGISKLETTSSYTCPSSLGYAFKMLLLAKVSMIWQTSWVSKSRYSKLHLIVLILMGLKLNQTTTSTRMYHICLDLISIAYIVNVGWSIA